MKKTILMIIFSVVLMVTGCALGTTNIPYASSESPEKLCTLRLAPTISVTQFDGEAVNWAGDFAAWGEVKIPEGTHTFVLTYSAAHGHRSGINFIAVFEAGRTYSMVAQPTSGQSVQIRIVEGTL